MIEHVVLFKIKPDTPDDKVTAMIASLHQLRGQVPGIVDLSAGRNYTQRGQGYSVGLVVRLQQASDLEVYLQHPAHQQAVQESIRPILADLIAVDYEI